MKRALLDTNVVVLLAVGLSGQDAVSRHKRTASFEEADFGVLVRFLTRFGAVAATPHALAEASNLLAQCPEPLLGAVRETFSGLVHQVFEVYVPSSDAVANDAYPSLGLTDASLVQASLQGYEVVTTDVGLYLWLASRELMVYNFHHIRFGSWASE